MKPVFQTKFHRPPETFGNCYAACYASILELPIEDVPPFEDMPGFANDDERKDWWWHILQWWLKDLGWFASEHKHDDGLIPQGFAIMSGQSPRFSDSGHCVVVLDGKVVHDPAGEGLEPITKRWDYIKLVPLGTERVEVFPVRYLDET